MKIPLINTACIAVLVLAMAQGSKAQSFDPFCTGAIINPRPLLPVEFNGTGVIDFSVGNLGSSPMLDPDPGGAGADPLTITISFARSAPDTPPGMETDAVTGPGAAWFDWSYLPPPANVLRGVQKAAVPIPPNSSEKIDVAFRVTQNSFAPSNTVGVNINIQPPGYSNQTNTTNNDNTSIYTFVDAYDYSDAPASYGTPRHQIDLRRTSNRYNRLVYLGTHIDAEDASQHSSDATGDDANDDSGFLGVADNDEDGIVFPPMIAGTTVSLPVTFTVWDFDEFENIISVRLRGWIDWNRANGFESTVEEAVIDDNNISSFLESQGSWTGPRTFTRMVSVAIPGDASGSYFLRLRIGPNTNPTNNALYGEVEDHMFEIQQNPGSISGIVASDTTGDGIGDTLVAGVELRLLDANGDPVLDGGGFPITTTTDVNGAFIFTNVSPGDYQVAKIPSSSIYTSLSDSDGGDPDLIGSNTLITVVAGVENENNNFLEFLQACPDLWVEWQNEWDTILGGQTGLTENPDGDRYSNLLEYAFCMPPNNGAMKPFCLFASDSVPGGVDGIFSRTAGGPNDITYFLDYTSTLSSSTVWSTVLLGAGNTTVTNDGNGKEIVRISDLETITGLGAGEGFVRIRVALDNGTETAEDTTEVLGWVATELGLCCRTYNNPFLPCATFTGTVDSVNGQELVLTTSAGSVDLSTLLTPGVAYYIEVESGDLEGHRFDITGATATGFIIANDSNLCSADAPFNTLTGAAPALLAGDRIAVHSHKTLDSLFPPASFASGASQAVSDEVQVYADGGWVIYWLFDDSGTARWVDADDLAMANAGSAVIPAGQGVFFQKRNSPTSLLAYGEVREHDFRRPLCQGVNMVGGGYPIDQSATGPGSRQLNLADGFFGSRDFKTADSFFIWRKDEDPVAVGYDTYFLLNSTTPAALRWIKVGDPSATMRDSELLLKRDGGVMTRVSTAKPGYLIPSPWTP